MHITPYAYAHNAIECYNGTYVMPAHNLFGVSSCAATLSADVGSNGALPIAIEIFPRA